ncbi:MAG: hypothetical protein HFF50_02140 [Lawsonibacter sp.]|nr:hypothetical protein [Lawsonibacter sp.]
MLLLIAILFPVAAALLLWFLLALWRTGCVVRVSFNGLDNMFHIPYEYYALNDRGAIRVPGFLAKAVLGSDTEKRTIYDDSETAYWFVTLQYRKDELASDRKPHLDTSFGAGYWLVYDNWTRSTPIPGEEDLALMIRAAEALHDGDLDNWVWQGGGATGLASFMVIRNRDQYLLEENGERLLLPLEDGGFQKIMNCPTGGHFDCWFFK